MKKFLLIFLLVVLIGITIFALFILGTLSNPFPTLEDNREAFYCAKDEDCTMIKGDCCGCSAGGSAAAINKKYVNLFKKKIEKTCRFSEVPCKQVMMCAGEKPACVGNLCKIVSTNNSTL